MAFLPCLVHRQVIKKTLEKNEKKWSGQLSHTTIYNKLRWLFEYGGM